METGERQARLIYALIVAGKSAKFADRKTRDLLTPRKKGELPFNLLKRLKEEGRLTERLVTVKTGNYYKLTTAFEYLAKNWKSISLETCSPQDLEKIPGVGPKTSRFFIMWTRPEEKYAALDTHVLRWLRAQGYLAPFSTPTTTKSYAKWEEIFLKEAVKRKMKPSELDAQIWEEGSRTTMANQVNGS